MKTALTALIHIMSHGLMTDDEINNTVNDQLEFTEALKEASGLPSAEALTPAMQPHWQSALIGFLPHKVMFQAYTLYEVWLALQSVFSHNPLLQATPTEICDRVILPELNHILAQMHYVLISVGPSHVEQHMYRYECVVIAENTLATFRQLCAELHLSYALFDSVELERRMESYKPTPGLEAMLRKADSLLKSSAHGAQEMP